MFEEYLTKSLSDLVLARQAICNYQSNNGLKDMKNLASYHVQQAIEKMLKYCIYNNQPGGVKELYIHDLDRLIKDHCVKYGISVPRKIVKNANEYTRWEAESRYALKYTVRITSIISALVETEDWLLTLKPSYKKNIMHYRSKYKFK
ncbi:MAG: HEPN domain-containing protein [Butyrivibrio sp.]|nr:HEPN domain-containing protein [Butyrivibrio sp.]